MNKQFKIIFSILILILFSACSSNTKEIYFDDEDNCYKPINKDNSYLYENFTTLCLHNIYVENNDEFKIVENK